MKEFHHLPSENRDTIAKMLNKVMKTEESVMVKTPKKEQKYHNMKLVNSAASEYGKVADKSCSFDFNAIRLTLERIHDCDSSTITSAKNDEAPILDVSKASISELHFLLNLFNGNILQQGLEEKLSTLGKSDISKAPTFEVSEEKIAQELFKFIPITAVRVSPKREPNTSFITSSSIANMCAWCNRKSCNLKICCYPRTGLVSAALCTECISYNIQEDAKDWAKASLELLDKVPNEEEIIASLGCALIAMALGYKSQDILKKIVEKLESHCKYTVAYSILCLAVSLNKADDKEKAELLFTASSILKKMARTQEMTVKEKATIALASKDAFDAGLCINPNLLQSECKQKEIDNLQKKTHSLHLASLYKCGNFLAVLRELAKDIEASGKCFLTSSGFFPSDEELIPSPHLKSNWDEMFSSDNLKEKSMKKLHTPGFSSDEHAVKNDYHAPNFQLETMIELLNDVTFISNHLFPTEKLTIPSNPHQKFEEMIISFFEISLALKKIKNEVIIAFKSNMAPPNFLPIFEDIFNSFYSNSHQKFEMMVLQLYESKKWSSMQVAGAYIDRAIVCQCSVEQVICYLLAAMWMARDFKQESTFDPDMLFAYKSILMRLLLMASDKVIHCVRNPGLELHVIRLALGIIRKITLVPGSQNIFTEDDVFFSEMLLQRLRKVSCMFPFWNPPSISLSKAVTLDIFTRLIHSDFLFQLQSIKPEDRELKDADLTYQLYCNDLCGIVRLKNSLDFRAKTMDELLKSQNITWNDVRQTMSIKLCPRDKEGWIIPSPNLGIPLEYSELAGFIFDADGEEPFVKLLVVEADQKNGRNGLFSQEDVNVLLQLKPDESLFFSLDPPTDDLAKFFHPFQQWRYSKKIEGTEVLNTMFITDYLMKSFTSDSDISSMPPFKQRPCKHGLFKHLPPKLQEALRPLQKRVKGQRAGRYRFWIEPKDVKYKVKQNGLRFEYQFGAADMVVNTQSKPHGISAAVTSAMKMIETSGPHVSFARDMTENYTELSKYYPVFGRLQQLSKLHFLSFELQLLVQKLSEQYPRKSSALKCFIESYKQHQSQPSQSSNCKWVPASISPTFWSVSYGGVVLRNGMDDITGCYGKESLQKNCISPEDLLPSAWSDLKLILQPIKNPYINGTINCTKKIRGIYMIQHPNTGKVLIGQADNVFQRVEDFTGSVKNAHFSAIALRENVTDLDAHNFMQTLCNRVPNLCTDVKDFSPEFEFLTYDDGVGGVKLSGKGDKSQSEETLPHYESVTEVPIHVKKVLTTSESESVNYSPPTGNAERKVEILVACAKRMRISTDSNEGEDITIYIKKLMSDEGKINLADEQPLTSSTFRKKNSTKLNVQIDRLYYALHKEQSENFAS